jgi:DNA polymerase III alpha subunit (gram-positive type)
MKYIYLTKTATSLKIDPKFAKKYLMKDGYLNTNGQPTKKGQDAGIIWCDEEECRKRIWFEHGRQTNMNFPVHTEYPENFLIPYLNANKENIKKFAQDSRQIPKQGILVPDYKNPNDIRFHTDFVVLSILPIKYGDSFDIAEITLMDSQGNEIYHSLFKPLCPITLAVYKKSGFVDSMLENQKSINEEFDTLKSLYQTYKSNKIVCTDLDVFDKIVSAFKIHNINEPSAIFNDLDTYCVIPHAMNQYSVKYKTLKRVCEAMKIKYEEPTRTSYDCHALLHCLSKLKKETT